MSSISSTERSRQTDEVRSAREEYENREAENYKKTRKQLQKLSKQQAEELARVKEQYDEAVVSIRGKAKETIDERDRNHAEQTDKLRSLYHEQLRRKAEDSEQQKKLMQETRKAESETHRRVTQQQREQLMRGQTSALADKDRQFEDYTVQTRENVKKALDGRTDKLNDKHEKEVKAIIDDRSRILAENKKTIENQSTAHRERLRDLESHSRRERDKISSNWETVLRNKEEMHQSHMENSSAMLKDARESQKQKFERLHEDKRTQFDQLREDLRGDVADRFDRDVRSAKHRLMQEKSANLQNTLKNERVSKIERNNLVQQYEDRMRDYERQNKDINEVAKDVIHSRVNQVVNKSDKILQETNRDNKLDKETIVARNRADRVQLEEAARQRVEQEQVQADLQVKRVMNSTRKETLTQQDFHDRQLDELKNNYVDRLTAQRDAHLDGITKTRREMDDRVKRQELKAIKREDLIVGDYETKLKTLKDNHERQVEGMQKAFKVRQDELVSSQRNEIEQLKMKYEIQAQQQNEQHRREIERNQTRNDERIATLVARAEYNRKTKG